MAVIQAQEVSLAMGGFAKEPDILSYGVTNGQTLVRGDLAILASGLISKAASNVNAAIVGFAAHGSADVFFTGIGGAAAVTDTALFGSSVAGTTLQSGESTNIHIIAAHNNQAFEMSVVQAKNNNLVGTTFGLVLTSGIWLADNSQVNNAVITLVSWVDGPGKGATGDTQARGIFTFAASKLAV